MLSQEVLRITVDGLCLGRNWNVMIKERLKRFTNGFISAHPLSGDLHDVDRVIQAVRFSVYDDPLACHDILQNVKHEAARYTRL